MPDITHYPVVMGWRKCRKCRKWQRVSQFKRIAIGDRQYFVGACKGCTNAHRRQRYKQDPVHRANRLKHGSDSYYANRKAIADRRKIVRLQQTLKGTL